MGHPAKRHKANLEPIRVHVFKKLIGYWISRGRANYGVDIASRALRGLVCMMPGMDFVWEKDGHAIEATAMIASFQFTAMITAVIMGKDMILRIRAFR